MIRFPMISAVAALAMLGGCASDYSYRGRAEVAVDAPIYYDDFYGPFYDGYWGLTTSSISPKRPVVLSIVMTTGISAARQGKDSMPFRQAEAAPWTCGAAADNERRCRKPGVLACGIGT
jgi:hypothetical protein